MDRVRDSRASQDVKRYDLLSKACATHNQLTRASSAGQGYDRHLMGLKVLLRPGEKHALFDDEAYATSQEWKLSTSGLNAGSKFMGTGFGAAWPDGYGINCECENGGSHSDKLMFLGVLVRFGVVRSGRTPFAEVWDREHDVV